jgi:2-methylcitrate dehydratase PrpD
MQVISRLIDRIVPTPLQNLPAEAVASCKRFSLDTHGSGASGFERDRLCCTRQAVDLGGRRRVQFG